MNMGLLTKEVEVNITSRNVEYFENLGYTIPRVYDKGKHKYIFKKGTTRDIKDKLFYFLKDVKDLDKYVKDFWNENEHKIKKWYIEQKEENDVIITANYEFLIREICNRLKIKNLIATEYDFKENKIKGIHSRGENKITLFKSIYPNYEVGKTYSDSMIDKPLLEIGNPGYLVKGNELIEYKK